MMASESIRIRYTNWRGETADREIEPLRIWWGNTEWHPDNQWFMEAYDAEKGVMRDFALTDMVFLPAPTGVDTAMPERRGGE